MWIGKLRKKLNISKPLEKFAVVAEISCFFLEIDRKLTLSHRQFPKFPQNNLSFRKLRKPSGIPGKSRQFPNWVFPDDLPSDLAGSDDGSVIGVNRAFEWCGGQVGVLNWWFSRLMVGNRWEIGRRRVPCRP